MDGVRQSWLATVPVILARAFVVAAVSAISCPAAEPAYGQEAATPEQNATGGQSRATRRSSDGPTISGRVLHESGEPVAGASVWLIQSQYSSGVLRRSRMGPNLTSEDGRYSFEDGLEEGRAYYVVVDRHASGEDAGREALPIKQRKPIEASTYYGDVTSLGVATPLILSHGERRERVDIRIRKANPYCVDGHLQVEGEPFALFMTVEEAALAGVHREIEHGYESAQDGLFRFCDLTPGQYALFTPENANSEVVVFTINDSDVHQVLLKVDTNSPDLHLDLNWDGDPPPSSNVKPEAVRPGELKPSDHTGLATESRLPQTWEAFGIAVDLLNANDERFRMSADGKRYFETPYGNFYPVPSGDYSVEVHLPGGSYVKQITDDGMDIAGKSLHLSPGASATLRIVASQGGGTITCRVNDADGKPSPGTAVVLVPEGVFTPSQLSTRAQQAHTDSRGVLESGTLAPSTYRVLALGRPFRQVPEDLDKLLVALDHAQTVQVSARSNIRVNLQIVPLD